MIPLPLLAWPLHSPAFHPTSISQWSCTLSPQRLREHSRQHERRPPRPRPAPPRPELILAGAGAAVELIGYVIDLGAITVRAVVSQADIDLVRSKTRAVHARLAERPGDSVPGVVRRVVPGATARLPATALGSGGGGQVAVDLRDERGVKTLERVFQVDVELQEPARYVNVGGRAYLRFDHGRAPLALQWYRQLRQLFLGRFDA